MSKKAKTSAVTKAKAAAAAANELVQPVGFFAGGSFGYQTINNKLVTMTGYTIKDVEEETDPTSFILGRSVAAKSLAGYFDSHFEDMKYFMSQSKTKSPSFLNRDGCLTHFAIGADQMGIQNSNKSGIHFFQSRSKIHPKSLSMTPVALGTSWWMLQSMGMSRGNIRSATSAALVSKLVATALNDYSDIMLKHPERLSSKYIAPTKKSVVTGTNGVYTSDNAYVAKSVCKVGSDRKYLATIGRSYESLVEFCTLITLVSAIHRHFKLVLNSNNNRHINTPFTTASGLPYSECDGLKNTRITMAGDLARSLFPDLLLADGFNSPLIIPTTTLREADIISIDGKRGPVYAKRSPEDRKLNSIIPEIGEGAFSVSEADKMSKSWNPIIREDLLEDMALKLDLTDDMDKRTVYRAFFQKLDLIESGIAMFNENALSRVLRVSELNNILNYQATYTPESYEKSLINGMRDKHGQNIEEGHRAILHSNERARISLITEMYHPLILLADALLTRLYTHFNTIISTPIIYCLSPYLRFYDIRYNYNGTLPSFEELVEKRDFMFNMLKLGEPTDYGY